MLPGLSDRQAAEAVRSRIDWKYTLGLELTDSGFDHTVLREFRQRLLGGNFERQLLDLMLVKLGEAKLIKSRGKQRTDSTHIEASIRKLNRLELVGETLRHALNELARIAPQWLLTVVNQDWFDRYTVRFEQYRLPKKKAEQMQLALSIGTDGHHLLAAFLDNFGSNINLQQLEAVETLRQVWIQQYTIIDGLVVWRESTKTGLPANKSLIQSPYDIEARNRTKRDTNWTGYTLHLTETCDLDAPNLITNVETTPATVFDGAITQPIHGRLAQKGLLPKEHFVDTAYADAENLVVSQEKYQIELVSQAPPDNTWQAQAKNGFDLSSFKIDWETKSVQCPMGKTSHAWRIRTDGQNQQQLVEVRFHRKECANCQMRQHCTKSKTEPRLLKFRNQHRHEALQTARKNQADPAFQKRYAKRAGIEGTISLGVCAFDLRRSRYIGLAKTHLQHIATAVAINFCRLFNWWNQVPRAQTRVSSWTQFCHTYFNLSSA